ncbi:hypothetical protein PAESOLCIP111_01054 [Paenibacillus solanacearum]|uniref:Uncharacterized protein n=1 Tax=Paenibacillus solanacearum TaxID=2048548 RepID=A0A916JXI3_9BACL|nr:hypothetical protein PAESOLCIP111_01054 [Paenibacillus solanacearum]
MSQMIGALTTAKTETQSRGKWITGRSPYCSQHLL